MNILPELAVPLESSEESSVPDTGGSDFKWVTAGRLSAIAATVVLGVALLYFSQMWTSPSADTNGYYSTAVGQQETIILSDGSTVLLNTNSQMKVEYSSDLRDIHLIQGEAHFSVAKDPNMPFRVFAGIGRIDAVGTAFAVHMNNGAVDVTVTEGQVALASAQRAASTSTQSSSTRAGAPPDTGIVPVIELGRLKAGQVATISSDVDQQSNRVNTLDNLRSYNQETISKRLSWREGMVVFSGEPLDEVVREISRYTTVRIDFADPSVRSIRIGGRFPVGETDTMFEALETNFGLEVTRLDHDHVLVSAGNRK